jgi:hypothetical protein
MLDIHLYGKFREFAEKKGATDNSVITMPFVEQESMEGLLHRIGIDVDDIGELFINFKVVEVDGIIPHDESRIAIFPIGMHLLCGGQHLKGHGFIQKKKPKETPSQYW